MSCFKKKEVENCRDALYKLIIERKRKFRDNIRISIDNAETIAEMLDEYASGNMCEVEECRS